MKLKTILWDLETFGFDFKADKGFLLCMGWKELGSKEVHIETRSNLSSSMWDDKEVAKKASSILCTADRWVTHNGKKFDVRFLNGRLIINNLPLLPPMGKRHIDTCEETWKNIAMGASLKNIQEKLDLRHKKTPVDLQTWTKAATGNKSALFDVVDHCKEDVFMLEEYFLKLTPIHSMGENTQFHTCDKKFLRSNGHRVADKKIFKRLFCLKCGGWFKGEELK